MLRAIGTVARKPRQTGDDIESSLREV
jgi:hypothetical protein